MSTSFQPDNFNSFNVLPIEEPLDKDLASNIIETKMDNEKFWIKDNNKRLLECKVPTLSCYVWTMDVSNLTHTLITVNIQTLDKWKSFDFIGLLDNRATHCFINEEFV